MALQRSGVRSPSAPPFSDDLAQDVIRNGDVSHADAGPTCSRVNRRLIFTETLFIMIKAEIRDWLFLELIFKSFLVRVFSD